MNSGPEFTEILPEFFKKFAKYSGIFNQKLKSASDREFYSLYGVIF
jgi:hypothetical protein